MANQVFIVGHKNPDNDSIAAAVSYAYLKNALEAKKAEAGGRNMLPAAWVRFLRNPQTILEQVGRRSEAYRKGWRRRQGYPS